MSILVGFGFYWTKCQLGVDIIDDFSWEEHFPLMNVFQKQVPVTYPRPGAVLIQASFDRSFALAPWIKVYSTTRKFIREQIVKGGRSEPYALMIEDFSDDFWVKEYSHWIAVNTGDRFGYSGLVRLEDTARVYMGLTLYDENKHVIDWNSAATALSADGSAAWKELSSRLTVPGGVAFIRFRVSGEKKGRVYVDDIRFWKEQ